MAGRRNYYFRQKVTEAELDAGFTGLEDADRALAVDNGIIGVVSGGSVSQRAAGQNLSIDVAAGVAYDKAGKRISWGGTQNVSVATDYLGTSTAVAAGGNYKIVSVFAKFKRNYSDARTDGNSATVYFVEDESFEFVVRQSAEAVTPTAPSLDAEYILLCDIVRSYGQTAIINANIVDHATYSGGFSKRREDAYVLTAGAYTVRTGQPEAAAQALLTHINDHVVDTTAAHAASAISYNGSGNWADATAVTSTTVEAAIDEVVSDLAATSGAAKIGYDGSGAWADATTVASGSVNSGLDGIVSALAGTSGAAKVGYDGSGTWADATTVASGSVNSGLDGIVSALASTAGGGKVGFTSAQAWKDATTIASANVTGAITEVIADLAANAGAARIGTAAGPTWYDGDTSYAAGSSVQSALDAIVNGLKSSTAGASGSGSEHIGSAALSDFYSGTTKANPAGSFYLQVNKIITDLGLTTAGDSGAKRVACEALNNWADGTTNPAGSIVTMLGTNIIDRLAGTGGGAKIGFTTAATWKDATGISAGNVTAAIAEIVTDLAANAGASRIGTLGSGNWADGNTAYAAGTSVETALDQIVGDLADSDATTSDGAARVGAKATGSFSQGSVRSQLDALDTGWAKLSRANTFSAAQTFNGDGTQYSAALATTTKSSGITTFTLLWALDGPGSEKIRLYTSGGSPTANIGLVITVNAAWSALGWVQDTTASNSVKYHFGYASMHISRKASGGSGTFNDSSWDVTTDTQFPTANNDVTFKDGVTTCNASQVNRVTVGGHAAGAGNTAYGNVQFRARYTATPTSISYSGSGTNFASGPTTSSSNTYGLGVSITATAAGVFNWFGTVTTAP